MVAANCLFIPLLCSFALGNINFVAVLSWEIVHKGTNGTTVLLALAVDCLIQMMGQFLTLFFGIPARV